MKVGMWIADKAKNDQMAALGMRPIYQLFVEPNPILANIADSRPVEKIAEDILERGKDTIIAGVFIANQMFWRPGIKVVAHRGKEFFIN